MTIKLQQVYNGEGTMCDSCGGKSVESNQIVTLNRKIGTTEELALCDNCSEDLLILLQRMLSENEYGIAKS